MRPPPLLRWPRPGGHVARFDSAPGHDAGLTLSAGLSSTQRGDMTMTEDDQGLTLRHCDLDCCNLTDEEN